MTYSQAIESLQSLAQFGMRLGLERMRYLASTFQNPEKRLRFIHVAGTNGKGSVCAFLESLYRASGLRVGLFTSPHLIHFGERIQINRQPISEAEVVGLLEEILPRYRNLPADDQPTLFEVVTLMALLHFERGGVDLVIWETGLGGRLDATNIVTPLATLITTLSLDHQQWLGNTVAEIAWEKAGIFKPGVPAITAVEAPEALAALRSAAEVTGCPLTVLPLDATLSPALHNRRLPLLGSHQRLNAALALATVETLRDLFPVSEAAIDRGLSQVNWLGRFQRLQHGNQTILLDGAHNEEGAIALRRAVEEECAGQKPILVLGILRDKAWREMLAVLVPLAKELILVPVQSNRTLAPEELLATCRSLDPTRKVRCAPSLPTALEGLRGEPLILIAGSLYLIGEALELLSRDSAASANERTLNEWDGRGRTEK